MAEPAKPVLVEYDAQRPLLRLFFGFLEAIVFVGYQHGYTTKLPPASPCSGGWTEGLEFIAYFAILAILIETIHWIMWRIVHRKEILSFNEEQELFGKTTKLGVRNRRLPVRGVQELFGPAAEIAEETQPPISPGPKDYILVESGGRLPLVPTNPLLAGVFGLGLIVVTLFFHSPNSADSCTPATFAWPDLLGRIIIAYAFLALGSIAEHRIVDEKRPSLPANVA